MAVLGGVAAGAAWATAGMGAAEVTNAMRVHKEAYMQDKRFFYAQHTEAVAHHGEVYAQAERHHAQSYAQGEGRYYQPDKQHRRTFEQARLQHTLDRDIAMRAEIRDGLRDEFDQKNNRQNALMVSQAVMLTCALQLGIVPELPSDAGGAAQWAGLTFAYSALLGGLSERAAASPDVSLTLRRAPLGDFEKLVAHGLKQYEREHHLIAKSRQG